MKPLREWIEEKRDDYPYPGHDASVANEEGVEWGWAWAMDAVLAELKARGDAGQQKEKV